jgi:hypothetical protein
MTTLLIILPKRALNRSKKYDKGQRLKYARVVLIGEEQLLICCPITNKLAECEMHEA